LPAGTIGTGTYIYDANTNRDDVNLDMGDSCPSTGWDEPPATLSGLIEYQNQTIAGFVDNIVYVSEPMYYHAFPADYQYKVDYPIVGLAFFNSMLIVLTQSHPIVLIGSDPASLTKIVLPYHAPCLSATSIVSTPYGVFWASRFGIMWTDGNQVKCITERIMSKDDWSAWFPTTPYSSSYIVCAYNRGRLYYFKYGTDLGFWLEVESPENGIHSLNLGASIFGTFCKENDVFYVIANSSGSYQICEFESTSQSYLIWTWKSFKKTEQNKINYSWLKIIGDFESGASVSVKVWADGVLKKTYTITASGIYPLPAGYKAREWEIEMISGSITYKATINMVALGTSLKSFLQITGS
jgi:hypothetical protein